MPVLDYDPSRFGPHWGRPLARRSQITFTWEELCKAAVTVGRRSWRNVLQHGTYSVLEILWRVAIVRANLMEASNGNLQATEAFIALDPSEKAP